MFFVVVAVFCIFLTAALFAALRFVANFVFTFNVFVHLQFVLFYKFFLNVFLFLPLTLSHQLLVEMTMMILLMLPTLAIYWHNFFRFLLLLLQLLLSCIKNVGLTSRNWLPLCHTKYHKISTKMEWKWRSTSITKQKQFATKRIWIKDCKSCQRNEKFVKIK